MKHIFIINPVAGTGKAREFFMPRILSEIRKSDVEYKVHITTKVGDARRFVKRLCSFRRDLAQTLRFYACGGDGTLSEVIDGAAGYSNVEIACIPAGTGNDFVRNFDKKAFKDIAAQIRGKAVSVDVMIYQTDCGKIQRGINLINMGVDTEAVKYMEMVKQKKILRGTSAYIFGAACAFFQLSSYDVKLKIDDKTDFDGEITLLAIGNGTTYGGGFKATPEAKVDDGLLDICLVRKINRRQFLQLVGAYKKGTHIQEENAKNIVCYKRAQKIEIQSETDLGVSIDGELIHTKNLKVEVRPQALRFVIPNK